MRQDAEFDDSTGSSDPFPDPVPASDKSSGLLPIHEILKRKVLTVRLVTWNLHGKQPPENMQQLFQPGQHDLCVVGTEECERTIEKSFIFRSKQKWETIVQENLGSRYKLVKFETLVAIHIMLFARQDLVPFISSVKSGKVASGFGNMLGNKGGVGISCRIGITDFVFINSHFAAHADSVPARNQDFDKINTEMPLFPPVHSSHIRRSRRRSEGDDPATPSSSRLSPIAINSSAALGAAPPHAQRRNDNFRCMISVPERHLCSSCSLSSPDNKALSSPPSPPPTSSPHPNIASPLRSQSPSPTSTSASPTAADPLPSPTAPENPIQGGVADTAKATAAGASSRAPSRAASPSKRPSSPAPSSRSPPPAHVFLKAVAPPKPPSSPAHTSASSPSLPSVSSPSTCADAMDLHYNNIVKRPSSRATPPSDPTRPPMPRTSSTPPPKPQPLRIAPPSRSSPPPLEVPAAAVLKRSRTPSVKSTASSYNGYLSPTPSLSAASASLSTAASARWSALTTTSSAPVTKSERGSVRSEPLSERFDRVFWMGDLNYRIKGANRELVDDLVRRFDTDGREPLVCNDELGLEMRGGKVFQGFWEGPLTFRPTYKFDDNSDTYDTSAKRRPPAYTDRILYKYRSSSSCSSCGTDLPSIDLVEYDSCPKIQTSDHRPVFALFNVRFDMDECIDAIGRSDSASRVCSIM